jgi:hypothetical protein
MEEGTEQCTPGMSGEGRERGGDRREKTGGRRQKTGTGDRRQEQETGDRGLMVQWPLSLVE